MGLIITIIEGVAGLMVLGVVGWSCIGLGVVVHDLRQDAHGPRGRDRLS